MSFCNKRLPLAKLSIQFKIISNEKLWINSNLVYKLELLIYLTKKNMSNHDKVIFIWLKTCEFRDIIC